MVGSVNHVTEIHLKHPVEYWTFPLYRWAKSSTWSMMLVSMAGIHNGRISESCHWNTVRTPCVILNIFFVQVSQAFYLINDIGINPFNIFQDCAGGIPPPGKLHVKNRDGRYYHPGVFKHMYSKNPKLQAWWKVCTEFEVVNSGVGGGRRLNLKFKCLHTLARYLRYRRWSQLQVFISVSLAIGPVSSWVVLLQMYIVGRCSCTFEFILTSRLLRWNSFGTHCEIAVGHVCHWIDLILSYLLIACPKCKKKKCLSPI